MTSSRSTSDPAELSGLSQLAADYDGLLCDLWGVVHNGVEAFPAADRPPRPREAPRSASPASPSASSSR